MTSEPLRQPADNRQYYGEDILAISPLALWKSIWHSVSVLAPLFFPSFMVRKLFGWRMKANYAVARPPSLDEMLVEALPDDAYEAISAYTRPCERAGFVHLCWLRSLEIGRKRAYFAFLLDQSGLVIAKATWVSFMPGAATRPMTKTNLALITVRSDGSQLNTISMSPKEFFPELYPSNLQILRLPEATLPDDALYQHARRMQSETDLVRFDHDSAQRFIWESTNRWWDHLLEHGFLYPLSDRQTERIKNLPPLAG